MTHFGGADTDLDLGDRGTWTGGQYCTLQSEFIPRKLPKSLWGHVAGTKTIREKVHFRVDFLYCRIVLHQYYIRTCPASAWRGTAAACWLYWPLKSPHAVANAPLGGRPGGGAGQDVERVREERHRRKYWGRAWVGLYDILFARPCPPKKRPKRP